MVEFPIIQLSVLISHQGSLLLGKLSKKWSATPVYALPGRILHNETTLHEAVSELVKTQLGAVLKEYRVASILEDQPLKIHIGVTAELSSFPAFPPSDGWESWHWFSPDSLPSLLPSTAAFLKCHLNGSETTH
jgi:hypothetical protein